MPIGVLPGLGVPLAAMPAPSLRLRLLLPLLAAASVLALIGLVFSTLWWTRDESLRAAQVNVHNLARVIEEQTAHMVASIDSVLMGVQGLWTHLPAGHRPSRSEMHRLLEEYVSAHPDIRSLYVLDARGAMLHDSASDPPRQFQFGDRNYFRSHVEADQGLYLSDMMQGRLTGRWGLVASRRLSDPDGSFAGVVVAALEPMQLEKAYAGIDIGPEGLVNLRHTGGRLIIRVPHMESAVGQLIPSTAPLLAQIRAQGVASGVMRSRFDGVTRIFSARQVPHLPLLVWVGLSQEEVLASWRRSAWVYGTATFLLIVLVIGVTHRLMREQGRREALAASVARSEEAVRRHRDHLQELVDERTRELVAARDGAEAANRAKSEFLANVSHELRTPMHAILSFSRLGQDKATDTATSHERLGQYFQRIDQSGERLLRLLNALLDLAKLEAGKMVYDMGRHDVRALAADIAGELDALARNRGVVLEIAPTDVACEVRCDAARIGQVLRNLMSNAIKYTPEGGVVRITFDAATVPGAADVTDPPDRPAVLVTVADQGPGIPESELEAVFDKFVQSSKTKSGAGGTGLGLSISREIVLHHGGRIWAGNGTGGGAFLKVLLPVDQEG